ncbi:MAG TPA: PEGA domain-containing protein [Thermoanaerobaculaceae bacterium]|nr:PEGA domain-containing protein [Thermoanaerobaculaceae bacterium]
MRSGVLAPVLIAGLLALALPFSSEARGADHGSGGRSFGGGHSGSGGAPGHGGRGGPGVHGGHGGPGGPGGHGGHGGPGGRPGYHGYYGYHGYGGFPAWGLYLSFPLWWNAYYWWGWPYWNYGYVPYDVYEDPGAVIPPAAAEPGATGESPAAAGAVVPGTSPVDLEVTPPSALVYLNGVLIGSVDEFGLSSDLLYLEAGEYALEFRAPGFRSRLLRVTVSGGNRTLISLDLQADPTATDRTAAPSPGLPHGRRFGPTFGPATAEASAPAAPAAPGAQPASATLMLQVSPPDAAVYLDGALLGTADHLVDLGQGIAVAPGAHRIDAVAPGHAGKTVQVNVEAGKTVEVAVSLD